MSMVKYSPTLWAEPTKSALGDPSSLAAVHDDGGRVRFKKFVVVLANTLAQNAMVGLCVIPKGARIVRGGLAFSSMGQGRTLDLGLAGADGSGEIDTSVSDDVDLFLDGIDVSGSGVDTFAVLENQDNNALYLTAKDVVLTAKALGGTFPQAGSIVGYVMYVVD